MDHKKEYKTSPKSGLFKEFYEWYHRDRRLPKRIVSKKNFTYRIIIGVLDKYCKTKDVLDVGSGVGTLDFYLAKKGKKITGIEISERAYNIAQKSLRLFGLENQVSFERADFFNSKIKKTYSFVICSEVLEHLPYEKRALEKIFRTTKKGGFFMLTVPSLNAPLTKFGNSIKAFDKRSGHLRRYTVQGACDILEEAGFKPIYTQKAEGILRNSLFVYKWGFPISRLANKFAVVSDIITFLDDISLQLLGESQVIVVSKKS
jgi:2-polyprenyl-3-methyl-5-hydroxy-6-metoxy-1,4-benzoquinol methylase